MMFYIIRHLYGIVKGVYDSNTDPRVQHLPLVGSLIPPLSIIGVYLVFVLHYGPKWMAHRKPFNLKYIMRFYNAFQVIVNAFLFVGGVRYSYLRKEFSLTCQPLDNTNTEPWMMKLLYITYSYYLTKYLDLLDTVFIVLRKKNEQISFLHVYHHAGMVFATYVAVTFFGGSHSTMLGIINLFIHTVMYSYYFVTSLSPHRQYVWWKRHITQLQLVQFGYLMVHFMMAMLNRECDHPMIISFVAFIQNLFMFVLFFDFYYKAYIKKKKPSAKGDVKANGGNPTPVDAKTS